MKSLKQINLFLKRAAYCVLAAIVLTTASLPTITWAQERTQCGNSSEKNKLSTEDQNRICQNTQEYDTFMPEAECGAGSGGKVGEGGDSLKNQREAFLYFIRAGLTPNQSAGLVGNLAAESSVIPDTQERNPIGGGRGGYGIAQWTGGRRDAIEKFAKSPEQLKTLQFQLDYLWQQELTNPATRFKKVYDHLITTTTLKAASDVILHEFESPLDQSSRVENARAALGQKVLDLFGSEAGAAAPGAATPSGGSGCADTTAGFVGFPLKTTKQRMTELNGKCFVNGAMCEANHPYAAHDIMADTGTPVLAIFDGTVADIGEDRCPGRLVSVFSQQQGVTVSYMHMSKAQTMVKKVGDPITAGQQIGIVGSLAEGCVAPHLHIDAAAGDKRPGCSRLDCPQANQVIFRAGSDKIKLPQSLYTGYTKLSQDITTTL